MLNRRASISAHSSVRPRSYFGEILTLICPNRNRVDGSGADDDEERALTIVIGIDRLQTQAGCACCQVRRQTKFRTASREVDADLIDIALLADRRRFGYVIAVKIVFKTSPVREIVGVDGPVRCGYPSGGG